MNNDELIIEQVTDGSTVTRKWLGFTDREIIFPMAGAVGSAMLLMLHNIGIPLGILAPLIPVPFVSALIILFVLVYKKPPHFAEDLLNETCCGSYYCPHSKKFSYSPDGIFVDDVIIWGDFGDGSWSCGLSLLIPPMDYSRNEDKNNLKHRIDSMLNFFAKENLRVQFYWNVGDNYSEIQDYDRATEELDKESLCYSYRKERSKEYEKQLSNRELRREELVVFISSEISEGISNKFSSKTYDKVSDELLKNIKKRRSLMNTKYLIRYRIS